LGRKKLYLESFEAFLAFMFLEIIPRLTLGWNWAFGHRFTLKKFFRIRASQMLGESAANLDFCTKNERPALHHTQLPNLFWRHKWRY